MPTVDHPVAGNVEPVNPQDTGSTACANEVIFVIKTNSTAVVIFFILLELNCVRMI